VQGPRQLSVDVGRGVTFSLLALHGECSGVTLVGARWPLSVAVIAPASSLGVSNVTAAGNGGDEPSGSAISLSVEHGVLTMIFPDYFGGSL